MTEKTALEENTSPFHSGEKAIHERLGIADDIEERGRRVIRPFMPDQHREFFEQLPFLVVGNADPSGWPWASILFAESGFVQTPDEKHIRVNALPEPNDPLNGNLETGSPLSFLGIELHTRRRNRVNVTMKSKDETGFLTQVDQSFGNCPQYINHREPVETREPKQVPGPTRAFDTIDMAVRQTIEQADFLFVASLAGSGDQTTHGVDVNHRGGMPGFVHVEGNTLTVPDYKGNFLFNTLGNFMLNPRAGLTFHNPANASLLQLTGTTEIIWDNDPVLKNFISAERAWRFHLRHGIERQRCVPYRWNLQGVSPSFKRQVR